MRKRRRTPEEAKALILDAVIEEISRVGVQGLRIKEVAKRAGLSHPLLLHYFGNKAGLLDQAIERELSRVGTELVELLQVAITNSESGDVRQLRPHDLIRVVRPAMQRNARLFGWLLLEGRFSEVAAPQVRRVAQVLHQLQLTDRPWTTFEHALHGLTMGAAALIVDALDPDLISIARTEAAGDSGASDEYLEWVGDVIEHSGLESFPSGED